MAGSSAQHRHDDAPDVRSRLLRAAQAQILATGIFDANVEQIARRAEASKQTLYTHFESKEQLFLEVLRLTMVDAGEAGEPDIAPLDFADAVRAYVRWIEKSALHPENLELYRANIAATTAFPTLAANLHDIRLHASHIGERLLAHPECPRHLADMPPERLSSWLGVLAMRGQRALLGFPAGKAERRARQEAIVQLCTGGWPTRAEPCATAPLSVAQPGTPPPVLAEPGSRLSQERWTELLRIAIRAFALAGLRNTSVENIAAAAQISKMTIYKRFESKQGLFAAAIGQAVDDLLAQRRPLAFGGDMRASLETAAREHDRFTQQQAYTELLCLMITQAPTHGDLIQNAWRRLTDPALRELAAQLEKWQAEGAVHPVDPMIAAEQFLLLAARGNRRLTAALPWDEDEARRHARDVTALFLP